MVSLTLCILAIALPGLGIVSVFAALGLLGLAVCMTFESNVYHQHTMLFIRSLFASVLLIGVINATIQLDTLNNPELNASPRRAGVFHRIVVAKTTALFSGVLVLSVTAGERAVADYKGKAYEKCSHPWIWLIAYLLSEVVLSMNLFWLYLIGSCLMALQVLSVLLMAFLIFRTRVKHQPEPKSTKQADSFKARSSKKCPKGVKLQKGTTRALLRQVLYRSMISRLLLALFSNYAESLVILIIVTTFIWLNERLRSRADQLLADCWSLRINDETEAVRRSTDSPHILKSVLQTERAING